VVYTTPSWLPAGVSITLPPQRRFPYVSLGVDLHMPSVIPERVLALVHKYFHVWDVDRIVRYTYTSSTSRTPFA